MANFVKTTRLIKTDDGTATNPKPIDPVLVETWNEMVKGIPQAIVKLPPVRPGEDKYGAYKLEYDLKVYYQIHLIGVSEVGNHLVCDVEFWQTKQDYLSNQPPILQNTFITQIHDPNKIDIEVLMEQIINDYLVRVSLADRSGDERDLLLPTTQNDPQGILSNLKTQALIEKEVEKI